MANSSSQQQTEQQFLPYSEFVKVQTRLSEMEGKYNAEKLEKEHALERERKAKKKDGVESESIEEKFENFQKQILETLQKGNQNPPSNTELPKPLTPEDIAPHFIGDFQQFCTKNDCHEDCKGGACKDEHHKNPKFKNEARCKNCKGPLGSIEGLKNLARCPYCGNAGTATDPAAERIDNGKSIWSKILAQ